MGNERQPEPDRADAARRLARVLQEDLAAADAEAPSFEDVAAYVEGRLAGDARSLFEERLAGDPLLRTEVADLRELRREMDAARRTVPEWTRWAAAAALLAASLGGWFWMRASRPVVETQTARSGGAAAGASTAGVPPVASLRDGSGPVALMADGSVRGLPATLQASAASALRSGALRVPPLRADLDVSGVTPMGATEPDAAFRPQAPLSTVVLSDRPRLRWSRHGHARGYVVSVYDLDLEPVAVSPRLTATEWTPARPLARGRTYLWQVEAITISGESETVPAPPAAEARFHVASAAGEREVRDVVASTNGSHLGAALALAERGLLDEASAELERLAELNPGSPEVERLRSALRAARER